LNKNKKTPALESGAGAKRSIDERPQSIFSIQSTRCISPPGSYPIHSGGYALIKNLLRAGIGWNEICVQPNSRGSGAMEVETTDTNSGPFVGQSAAYFGFNFFLWVLLTFEKVRGLLPASRQVI
jgi:hypothetical protein